MQLARHRIDAPAHGRPLKIYPIGDVHMGAAACDLAHFRRTVAQVAADPDARWFGMGDLADLIMPSDPRWSWTGLDWKNVGYRNGRPNPKNLATEHYAFVKRELEPIAAQCLGVHDGNHEDEMKKRYFVDVAEQLADDFKAPYLGYTAATRLDIASEPRDRGGHTASNVWTIDVFSEHGGNGGGTDGNATNKIQSRGADFDADIYFKGHVHKRGITHRTALGWGAKKIATRDRLFILTGTYLKGYSEFETPYGERKGYAPNEIGGTVIVLEPKIRRMHAMNAEALAAVAA